MVNKEVVQALEMARCCVEFGWTKGKFALGSHGAPVPERSRGAVCWCARGALARVADGDALVGASFMLMEETGDSVLMAWNDHPERLKVHVLDAFTRAIWRAKREAA